MNELISARLATTLPGISIGTGGALPLDIQWMPPGIHNIVVSKDGKPLRQKVVVNAKTAAVIQSQLQTMRTEADAGKGDKPYFDFNHDDDAASAHPTEFYWGGDDPVTGGVRAKLEWTEPGKSAVTGRAYRRFSPSFFPNTSGEVVGVEVNMGGLVNKAAFQKIQPLFSKGADNPQNKMEKTPEEKLADSQAQILQLQTEVATLKSNQTVQAKDGEIASLKTEITSLKDAMKIQAKAAATALVNAAVTQGRIPPANTVLQARFVDLITQDSANATLLEALPVNPALATVIAAGSAGAGAGTISGDHQFLVKAKAVAAEKKIPLADAITETARVDAKLYDEFRSETAQPKS